MTQVFKNRALLLTCLHQVTFTRRSMTQVNISTNNEKLVGSSQITKYVSCSMRIFEIPLKTT